MAIFNSYVKLPEGSIFLSCLFRRSPKTTKDVTWCHHKDHDNSRQPPFRWLRGNSNGPSCRKVAPDPDILMESFGRWMLDICVRNGRTEPGGQLAGQKILGFAKWKMDGTWMEHGWRWQFLKVDDFNIFQWCGCVWNYSKNGDFPEHTVSLLG